MSELLSVNNLSIGYKDREQMNLVFQSLDLSLHSGELTTLLGRNGVGKSTLIKTLCGVLKPLDGEVLVGDKNISEFTREELSKRMSIVLTERITDGGLTVFEMVSMGRYPYTGFFGRLTKMDKDIVEDSINRVGVQHLSNKPIAFLSDGERQKVMIAKSLAQQTDIIILDEPTAFLDVKSKIELVVMLRMLAEESGKAILMSSHDLELTLKYSDNLWALSTEGVLSGVTESVVMNGGLSSLVGNSDIFFFDYKKGLFRSKNSSKLKVKIIGNCDFWVTNIIERLGGVVVEDNQTITVEPKSINDISISIVGEEFHLSSIEDFVKFLRAQSDL